MTTVPGAAGAVGRMQDSAVPAEHRFRAGTDHRGSVGQRSYSSGNVKEMALCRKDFVNRVLVVFSPTVVLEYFIDSVFVRKPGRTEVTGRGIKNRVTGGLRRVPWSLILGLRRTLNRVNLADGDDRRGLGVTRERERAERPAEELSMTQAVGLPFRRAQRWGGSSAGGVTSRRWRFQDAEPATREQARLQSVCVRRCARGLGRDDESDRQQTRLLSCLWVKHHFLPTEPHGEFRFFIS